MPVTDPRNLSRKVSTRSLIITRAQPALSLIEQVQRPKIPSTGDVAASLCDMKLLCLRSRSSSTNCLTK